jgi:hypothetical protein
VEEVEINFAHHLLPFAFSSLLCPSLPPSSFPAPSLLPPSFPPFALSISIFLRDFFSNTPLHTAIERRHYWLADVFIQLGADVKAKGRGGQTALHMLLKEKLYWHFGRTQEKTVRGKIRRKKRSGNSLLHPFSFLPCL